MLYIYLYIPGGPKKRTQILIYNFLWTIGFYCAEFCALNIHSIRNLFLNFVIDYFTKQLNMACYRRLVIFTLFETDVKRTKISLCRCFHCDFQLVFYLSFLLFSSERRLHYSVFIFEKKSLYWTLNGLTVLRGLFPQTRRNVLYRNHGFLKRGKLPSRTILMKNNSQLIAYAKSIPVRTRKKFLFSGFCIDGSMERRPGSGRPRTATTAEH